MPSPTKTRKPNVAAGHQKTRLWLMYPPKLITKPLIWELTQKFPVVTNVRQASVTDEIGIVCYAPRNGTLGETGSPSPEFLLSRKSEEGRLLIAALADLQANKRPFGDLTGNHDPADMIRVRIRVRREATPDGSRIVLEKVLACHWIEVDEPGVVPVPPKAPEASAP